MSVEVHRAGRTYYPHQTVLLNQPGRELTALLNVPEWQAAAAAKFLGLPDVADRRLIEFGATAGSQTAISLSDADREELRRQGYDAVQIAALEKMQAAVQAGRQRDDRPSEMRLLREAVVRRSGVAWEIWERSGHELMEAVMPLEVGEARHLFDTTDAVVALAQPVARRLGLEAVDLATDFPITTASFGYSRVDYRPNLCRLNAFSADRDNGGRFPIFVDVVQADAILFRLDHDAVVRWLVANGHPPSLPNGTDASAATRGYFARLLDQAPVRSTLGDPQARMVFGLLHTLSHVALRRASLLSGLEGTSLSEYVLPRALTFALYCNHRFGATIGALTGLFEQSLREWLADFWTARRCVYDPVCNTRGGSCHACTHVAETSCRFFNLNLGRPFLFGGDDEVAGRIQTGFLDLVAAEEADGGFPAGPRG